MAKQDRWWGALAVLSHGVLIAGFGFIAEQSIYDPFSTTLVSFLALIPAVLVALAFRRWFRGRPRWLILFDIIIAAVGFLGLWGWSSPFISTDPGRFEIDDVAVYLAVAAAVVALVTSLHTMRAHPGPDPMGTPGDDVDPIAPVTPSTPVVDVPPTT